MGRSNHCQEESAGSANSKNPKHYNPVFASVGGREIEPPTEFAKQLNETTAGK
jgi:hypothetical protein